MRFFGGWLVRVNKLALHQEQNCIANINIHNYLVSLIGCVLSLCNFVCVVLQKVDVFLRVK